LSAGWLVTTDPNTLGDEGVVLTEDELHSYEGVSPVFDSAVLSRVETASTEGRGTFHFGRYEYRALLI